MHFLGWRMSCRRTPSQTLAVAMKRGSTGWKATEWKECDDCMRRVQEPGKKTRDGVHACETARRKSTFARRSPVPKQNFAVLAGRREYAAVMGIDAEAVNRLGVRKDIHRLLPKEDRANQLIN